MESSSPAITVLVTCYNRKTFLKEALGSVTAQEIDRPFEIVLIKNFNDNEIDSFCREKSIKLVYDESEIMGKMIANGVMECSGDIVAFLDDDDLFLPSKIQTVLNYFNSNKNLGVFHNSFSAIDTASKPTVDRRHRHPSQDITLRATDADEKTMAQFEQFSGNVNMSSIAVKRDVLVKHVKLIRQMWGVPETFLTFLSWIEGKDAILSAEKLTLYRIHIGESKGDFENTEKMKTHLTSLQKKYVTSYTVLSNLDKNRKLKQSVEYRVIVAKLRLEILEKQRNKNIGISESFHLLDSPETRLLSLSLIFFNLLHSVIPELTSRLYILFRKQLLARHFEI